MHATLDHATLGHAALDHATLDHATLDHTTLDHAALDHATLDHAVDITCLNEATMLSMLCVLSRELVPMCISFYDFQQPIIIIYKTKFYKASSNNCYKALFEPCQGPKASA